MCGGAAWASQRAGVLPPQRAVAHALLRLTCTRRARPAHPAVAVNGGLVTTLLLGTKLWEHRRAVRAEQQALGATKARKAQ